METCYSHEVMDRCNGVSLLNCRWDERMLDFDSSLSEWSFWRDPFVQDNGSLTPQYLGVDGNFTNQDELPSTSQKKQSELNAIQGNGPFALDISSMQEDLMEKLMSEENIFRSSKSSCGYDKDVMSIAPEKVCGVEIHSTSIGTFNWATRSLIPCSNADSSDNKGMLLIYLLTTCAEAISDGSHDLAHILLGRLREMVCVTGSTVERVAFYLSRVLHHRHQLSLGESSMEVNLKPRQLRDVGTLSLLNQAFPFIRIPHFTANQSILEAIIKGERQKIHIVDFDIMEGMQWPPLMEALKSGAYEIEHLKITAVKWDCGDDENNEEPSMCTSAHTGRMLSEYAASLGIPFSFEETAVENLKRDNDEVVAVNCMWELPHMCERSRTQLSKFIEGARWLDPVILTVGTGPPDEPHQNNKFLESFGECLKNLCAVFDCSEAGLAEPYSLARAKVEILFLAPMICRPLNYSGQLGPIIKVLDIPPKCGFVEGEISKKNVMYANQMLIHSGVPMQYGVKCLDSKQLLLEWHSTVFSRLSVWKPINYSDVDIIPDVCFWQ